MELFQLAGIIQGNIPTRIEANAGKISDNIETITMQELNYIANISDEIPTAKFLMVQSDKLDSLAITQENDVVVSLSSGTAIVIDSSRANKLILSNLAIVRIKSKDIVDPYYLCWYISNKISEIRKMQQGTFAVSIIPISVLKNFEVALIPIDKQILIGNIYELKRKRDRLTKTIENKKSKVLSQKLLQVFAREAKDGSQ